MISSVLPINNLMKNIYKVALYMRLSQDDRNYGDSVSIETQRTILRTYARDNGLDIVDEYVDDGWSGTNFDRPAFQRMMEDVDAGKINCIVTKDLSRFGREHVMMDYYLEFIFPEKHIRYIAVAENEDTEKGLTDCVPFKNLFNEWYAKDTSRKVKGALRAKFSVGEYICAYAPLGYKKDPEVKNHLIIDEETRWIIEKIFDLAAHGWGAAKITRTLREEKVPTPGWMNYTRYGTFANVYAGAPEEKAWAWTISQIKSITHDEVYIGNSVHGQQTTLSYKNKKRIRKPEEYWFRVENTHEALVPKEVFAQIQEQIDNRRRKMKNARMQIFSGLVRCADCGWSLSYATHWNRTGSWGYFNCTAYRQFGKIAGICSSHYIRYDLLYQYVLSQIQIWCRLAQADKEGLLEYLIQSGDRKKADAVKKKNSELTKAIKRKNDVDKLFTRMYEDRMNGSITEQNFIMLSQKYQIEQEELTRKVNTLMQEDSSIVQDEKDFAKLENLVNQYCCPDILSHTLLNSIIEKIVVHEGKTDENGIKTQSVEIYYRFRREMPELVTGEQEYLKKGIDK